MKPLFFLPLLMCALAGCGSAPPTADEQAQSATSDKQSILGRSMDKGEGVATDSNISQINSALSMVKGDNDGKAPANLDEAKRACKVPPEMWVDGATGKPLQYNPTTGTVAR